ncbi:MAG: hypothetical protein Q4A65_08850 [Bacillota bacterium]|nr:hypothetical protein [Bacillota bacterium]
MKKLTVILMIALLAVVFTSCGSGAAADIAGTYSADRALITIEADGDTDVKVNVTWGSSASENSEWVLSGTYDAKEGTIEYHDCVKTDNTYDQNGELTDQEEVYVGGHGFMFIDNSGDNPELKWQDDQEHAADDMVFVYNPDAAQ